MLGSTSDAEDNLLPPNPYEVLAVEDEPAPAPLDPSTVNFPLGLLFPISLGVLQPVCFYMVAEVAERRGASGDWLVGFAVSYVLCGFIIGAVLPGTFSERMRVGVVVAMAAVVSPVILVPTCAAAAVLSPAGIGAPLAFPFTFGVMGVYARQSVRGRETRKLKLMQIEQARLDAIPPDSH